MAELLLGESKLEQFLKENTLKHSNSPRGPQPKLTEVRKHLTAALDRGNLKVCKLAWVRIRKVEIDWRIEKRFLKLYLQVLKVRLIQESIFCQNLPMFITILVLLLLNYCCSYYNSLPLLYPTSIFSEIERSCILQSSVTFCFLRLLGVLISLPFLSSFFH